MGLGGPTIVMKAFLSCHEEWQGLWFGWLVMCVGDDWQGVCFCGCGVVGVLVSDLAAAGVDFF